MPHTWIALTCVPVAACFAVTDLDRFADCEEPPQESPTALRLQLPGVGAAVGSGFVDVIVFHRDDRNLLARAIVEDLDGVAGENDLLKVFIPGAIPGSAFAGVLVVGDLDRAHDYDMNDEPSIADTLCTHGRLAMPITAESRSGTDENPDWHLGGATVRFAGMLAPHQGQRLELRVVETDTGRVVGTYRTAPITEDAFVIQIPGIIAANTAYRLDFFADALADHVYISANIDSGRGDHSWSRPVSSDNNRQFDFSFAHIGVYETLDFAPPDF